MSEKFETPFSIGVVKETISLYIPNPRGALVRGNVETGKYSDGEWANVNKYNSKNSCVSMILDVEQAVDLLDILIKRLRIHDKYPEVDVYKAGYSP